MIKNFNTFNLNVAQWKDPKTCAFTLAEVLLTIAIIGVIILVTVIPFSINANRRALNAAKEIMDKDFIEILNRMRLNKELSGHETTAQFVNALKKYTKVSSICSNDKIERCLGYNKISLLNNNGIDFDVKNLEQPHAWALISMPTPTMGIRLAKGVTGVITYQRNCPWISPLGVSRAETTRCVSMVYDVNGAKKPNKVGEDIILLNAHLDIVLKTWVKGATFEVGDLISEAGYVLKCLKAHKSGSRSNTRNPMVKSNKGSWELIGTPDGSIPAYTSVARWAVGGLTHFNGNVYARTDYNLTGGQTPYSKSSSRYWILVGKLSEFEP